MNSLFYFTVFILTSPFSLLAALSSVACWIVVSDYFFYSWWGDIPLAVAENVFIIPSALICLGLAVAFRKAVNRLQNPESVVDGGIGETFVPSQQPIPLRAWKRMVMEVAAGLPFVARNYMRWLHRGIHCDGDPCTRSAFRDNPDAITLLRLILSGWLLVFWLFLAWSSIPCLVMEGIATLFEEEPAMIFAARSEAPAPTAASGVRLSELLAPHWTDRYSLPVMQRSTTARTGTALIIRAVDFPRVHRVVDLICTGDTPRCLLADAASSTPELVYRTVPLRAGRATVAYGLLPESVDKELELDVSLLRVDSLVLHRVKIQ